MGQKCTTLRNIQQLPPLQPNAKSPEQIEIPKSEAFEGKEQPQKKEEKDVQNHQESRQHSGRQSLSNKESTKKLEHLLSSLKRTETSPEKSKTDQIVDHWEKKLLESPHDGLAHDELGKAYYVKDEKDKSYHHLRRAIALKSHDHLTTYLLALIYESRGSFKDAIYYLVDTIEREPTFLKAYITLGEIFLTTSNVEKAMPYFQKAFLMDPNSTEVMNNIGLCYFNLQDYDKAIEYFTKAIRENYEFPRALNNLGNALRRKNQIAESINCYQQAIKVHSFLMKQGIAIQRFHIAHLNLATALTENSELVKAVEHLQYALEDNHRTISKSVKEKGLDNFIRHKNILQAMVDYESEEFDSVLISLEKIAGFMPENPVVNYYFGSTYLKLGSFNVSLKYFQAVLRTYGKSPRKMVNRVFAVKARHALGELKTQTQQIIRSQKQQLEVQRRLQIRGQGDSGNDIGDSMELEEGDKSQKIEQLKRYNRLNGKHYIKHLSTIYRQEIFSRRASPNKRCDYTFLTNSAQFTKGSFRDCRKGAFTSADMSSQKDNFKKSFLSSNLQNPAPSSPQKNSSLPIKTTMIRNYQQNQANKPLGSIQDNKFKSFVYPMRNSREGLPPLHSASQNTSDYQYGKSKPQIAQTAVKNNITSKFNLIPRTNNLKHETVLDTNYYCTSFPKQSQKLSRVPQSLDNSYQKAIGRDQKTEKGSAKQLHIMNEYYQSHGKRTRNLSKDTNMKVNELESGELSESQRHAHEVYNSSQNTMLDVNKHQRTLQADIGGSSYPRNVSVSPVQSPTPIMSLRHPKFEVLKIQLEDTEGEHARGYQLDHVYTHQKASQVNDQ